MAVFRPTGGEAQTAAGVRSRAFLPKTARRAPQALEAGAFWVHQPKSLVICSLSILLRRVLAVFYRWVGVAGQVVLVAFLKPYVTEDVYSLTACPAGGHFLDRQKVTKERPGLRPGPDGQRRQSLGGAPQTPPEPLGFGSSAWVTASISSCGCSMLGWAAGSAGGAGFSGLAGGALWPAPSFRLA